MDNLQLKLRSGTTLTFGSLNPSKICLCQVLQSLLKAAARGAGGDIQQQWKLRFGANRVFGVVWCGLDASARGLWAVLGRQTLLEAAASND